MTSPHARPPSPRWRLFFLFACVYLVGTLIGASLTAYQMRGRFQAALDQALEEQESSFKDATVEMLAKCSPSRLWQSAGWRER